MTGFPVCVHQCQDEDPEQQDLHEDFQKHLHPPPRETHYVRQFAVMEKIRVGHFLRGTLRIAIISVTTNSHFLFYVNKSL